MDRILVAVDGSEASVRAAVWAAELAAKIGAGVCLLHVHDAPGSGTLALGSMERAGIEEVEQRIAGPSFERARAAIGDRASVETLVSIGEPAEEIVGIARRDRVSLIVIGSRGLSPVKELLLGSVSEKVLRHAPCAVTVVR